jgi:hypothetical protein
MDAFISGDRGDRDERGGVLQINIGGDQQAHGANAALKIAGTVERRHFDLETVAEKSVHELTAIARDQRSAWYDGADSRAASGDLIVRTPNVFVAGCALASCQNGPHVRCAQPGDGHIVDVGIRECGSRRPAIRVAVAGAGLRADPGRVQQSQGLAGAAGAVDRRGVEQLNDLTRDPLPQGRLEVRRLLL